MLAGDCVQRYSYFMFPTRGKSKIPHTLSYPANAKLISELLADVPQAQDLSISFHYYPLRTSRKYKYPQQTRPVISVSYFYFKSPYGVQVDVGGSWTITVEPVFREIRHHIEELLRSEGLPQMRLWLQTKIETPNQDSSHSFNIFYNEAMDRLEYKQHSHL